MGAANRPALPRVSLGSQPQSVAWLATAKVLLEIAPHVVSSNAAGKLPFTNKRAPLSKLIAGDGTSTSAIAYYCTRSRNLGSQPCLGSEPWLATLARSLAGSSSEAKKGRA